KFHESSPSCSELQGNACSCCDRKLSDLRMLFTPVSRRVLDWPMRKPAVGFGRREQIADRSIERSRFLAGNRVPGTRNNMQCGRGHGLLEEKTTLQTW